MTIVTVTPPAGEPVSLAEAKLFLRVDHGADDALIQTLIAAARGAVEAGCGRALITRRVRESLDIWRTDARGGAVLGLGPVKAVHVVRLIAQNGSESVIDPARYRLDGAGDRPRLVFESGLPMTLRAIGGVEIEYDAGLADEAAALPTALRLAALHIIAALYDSREGAAGLPDAARALMRPFQPVRL